MTVNLLSNSKLSVAVIAARTCWNSFHKGGCYTEQTDDITITDKEFLDRIINKNKHASISEHIVYSFTIDGISRACLQELARTRIASLSVKSTRYTLKELKGEKPFVLDKAQGDSYINPDIDGFTLYYDFERASKYVVLTRNTQINCNILMALENLKDSIVDGISNDIAKFALPEAYKTSLVWTINTRSLQNFLHLRLSKHAMWEIRELANKIYEALPKEHKYLYNDIYFENRDT